MKPWVYDRWHKGEIEIQETPTVKTVFKWWRRAPYNFRLGKIWYRMRWTWAIRIDGDQPLSILAKNETRTLDQAKRNARLYMRDHANEVFGQRAEHERRLSRVHL